MDNPEKLDEIRKKIKEAKKKDPDPRLVDMFELRRRNEEARHSK